MPTQLELFDYIPGYHQTAVLDGKRVAFTRDTQFLIQIGKDRGHYSTKYCIRGSLAQAVMHYNGLNVANGYKKRLIVHEFNKPVLAREITYK